jgi:Rrf2 family protein
MVALPVREAEVLPGVRSLRVPARVDDALRALLVLAAAPAATPVQLTEVSTAEGLSPRFLSTVLVALRDHGLVHSHRGAMGGYWLARPADEITVADVYDAADLRGAVPVPGSQITGCLWHQVETELRARLEALTVADLLAGRVVANT